MRIAARARHVRVVQRVIALVVPAAFVALLVSFGARVYRGGVGSDCARRTGRRSEPPGDGDQEADDHRGKQVAGGASIIMIVLAMLRIRLHRTARSGESTGADLLLESPPWRLPAPVHWRDLEVGLWPTPAGPAPDANRWIGPLTPRPADLQADGPGAVWQQDGLPHSAQQVAGAHLSCGSGVQGLLDPFIAFGQRLGELLVIPRVDRLADPLRGLVQCPVDAVCVHVIDDDHQR